MSVGPLGASFGAAPGPGERSSPRMLSEGPRGLRGAVPVPLPVPGHVPVAARESRPSRAPAAPGASPALPRRARGPCGGQRVRGGDTGGWGHGVLRTRRAGDTGAGDTGSWGHGELGTRSAGDTECWGHGGLGTRDAGVAGVSPSSRRTRTEGTRAGFTVRERDMETGGRFCWLGGEVDYSPGVCSGCEPAPGKAGSDASLQAASLGEKVGGWGWHRAQQAGMGDVKVLRGSKASPGTEAERLLQPGTLQDQNHLGTAAPAFVAFLHVLACLG